MGHNTSSPLHAYAPRDGPRGFGHNRDPSEEMPEESGDGSATEQAQPANREQNASPVPAAAVSAADSDPPPDPADPSVVVESTRPVLNVSMDLLGASPPAPITMPSRCSSDSAATTATAAPNSEAAAILPASSQPSAHGAPTRLPQRSVSSVDQSTNFRSPRLSPTSLSSVSAAIRSHLQTPHGLTATSSHAIPQTPQTPSLLTSDAAEQKLILLRSLFQAIDRDSTGYLEREELLAWVEHEPWLRQPNLSRRARTLLNLVNHDEDSRCSRNEFLAAFESFSTPDIITLIVNLLRAGMVAKVPRVIFVQNTHDFYRNGLRFDATGRPEGGSGDSGEHSDLSSSDTPADTLLFGTHKEEASKHFFLLEVLFQSMDRDLDGKIDTKDLHRWLRADPFIQEPDNADLFQAVDACWKELAEQNAAAGFAGPALDAAAASRSSLSVSGNNTLRPSQSSSDVSLSSAAAGPARVDRHFFFLQFSQVPKKLIRRLLVHLLSRNASSVMEAAQQERRDRKEMGKNVAAGSAAAAATPAASPTTLPHFHHPLVRKHSVVIGGSKRVSLAHGLRVSLVGQSMLQHDIRAYPSGAACIAAMRPLLTANCIFTELETALVREGRQPQKQRNSVFFHAAHPVVIDVLQDIGFNFFATANNHSGDLGEEGLQTIMEEFESRRLVQAGIGMNARRASLPSYLDTPNGRIAQVAFASKIPEHSIATNERAGVNSLSMADVDTSTLNQEELSRLLSTITMARAGFIDPDSGVYRSPADMVIAYHHNHYWEKGSSVNTASKMGSWKRDLAHLIIDAGAHVYVAHGDPRLQGIEIYRGCPLFYCLGNFVFQTKTELAFYGSEVWQSVLVHLHCNDIQDGTSYSIKLIPVQLNEKGETDETHFQTRGLPSLATRSQGLAILHKLACLSAEFGTAITVEDSVEGDESSPVIGWVVGAEAAAAAKGEATKAKTATAIATAGSTPAQPSSSPISLSALADASDSVKFFTQPIDSDSIAVAAAATAMGEHVLPPAPLLRQSSDPRLTFSRSPQAAVFSPEPDLQQADTQPAQQPCSANS